MPAPDYAGQSASGLASQSDSGAAGNRVCLRDGPVCHRHILCRCYKYVTVSRALDRESNQLLSARDCLCPLGWQPIGGRRCFVGDPADAVDLTTKNPNTAVSSHDERVRLAGWKVLSVIQCRKLPVDRVGWPGHSRRRVAFGTARSERTHDDHRPEDSLRAHAIQASRHGDTGGLGSPEAQADRATSLLERRSEQRRSVDPQPARDRHVRSAELSRRAQARGDWVRHLSPAE
jgi:hypothetical protein